MAYRIEHDCAGCIGCGACVAVCPEFFEMGNEGKAVLKGAKKKGNSEALEVAQLGKAQDAANVCPVNVIHITDLKTNKKLI